MSNTNFTAAFSTTSDTAAVEKLAASFDKLSGSLDNAGKKAQEEPKRFEKFAAGARDFIQNPLMMAGEAAEQFLLKIGPVGAGVSVAAVGIGVMGTAAIAAAKQLGQFGDNIEDISIRTGLTVKEVGQFDYAMRRAGGSIGSIETAMRQLSRGLSDTGTEGKQAREALDELGVRARNSDGTLRPMSQIIREIAAGLSRMTDTANRNRLAMDALGRSGLEMLPDLLELSKGLERASKIDLGINDDSIRRFGEYHKMVVDLETEWEALKRAMKEPIVASIHFVWKQVQDNQGHINRQVPGSRVLVGAGGFVPLPQKSFDDWMLDTFGDLMAESRSGHARQVAETKASTARMETTRRQFGLTKEGIEEAYRQAKRDADAAREKYFGGDLSGEKAYREKTAEAVRLKAQLDAIVAAEKSAFTYKETANPRRPRAVPSLRVDQSGRRFGGDMLAPALVVSEADIAAANQGRQAADNTRGKAILDGIAQGQQLREESAKRELEHRVRMAELLAGPGGELAAIERIYSLRVGAAKTQEEAAQAAMDREERIAELQRRRLDEYRSMASNLYRDLRQSGGRGVGDFARSQLDILGEQVFTNASGKVFKSGGKALGGIFGNPGGLFTGTIFDPANKQLDVAMSENTKATVANTNALMSLAMSPSGGGGGLPAGDYLSRHFGLFGPEGPSSTTGWAARNKNLLSGIGIAAGTGLGIYSGITTGGARGALISAGSVAGGAGAAISAGLFGAGAAAGPAAPILMGAGMALGFITSLFGDPRQKRAESLERQAQERQFDAPVGAEYSYDIYGRAMDYDYRGRVRTVVNYYDQRKYEAMDAASFVEWGKRNPAAVAEVNTHSITSGNADDLVGTLRQTL
jgi:hypothetical protein